MLAVGRVGDEDARRASERGRAPGASGGRCRRRRARAGRRPRRGRSRRRGSPRGSRRRPGRSGRSRGPRRERRASAISRARGEASMPIASRTRGARRKQTSPRADPRSRTTWSGEGSASRRMSRSRSRHLRAGAANAVTRCRPVEVLVGVEVGLEGHRSILGPPHRIGRMRAPWEKFSLPGRGSGLRGRPLHRVREDDALDLRPACRARDEVARRAARRG